MLILFCPETSEQNILYRRARRLRALLHDDRLIPAARRTDSQSIFRAVLIQPFVLTFTEPIVLSIQLYIGLINALLFLWLESFTLVFQDIYGFTIPQTGLAYLGLLTGSVVIIPFLFWWFHSWQSHQFRGETIEPEKRLPPALLGSICVPICLFWFGWTSRADVHWIVPIVGTSFFGAAQTLLYASVFTYLTDVYKNDSASAMAGVFFIRAMFGAGFPLFGRAMYNRLGIGWASSLLGFLGAFFVLVTFALWQYGSWVRRKSPRALHDT